MLVIKNASNIFLTRAYVCPLRRPLYSNKIFATLKWVCSETGKNYSEISQQRTPWGPQNSVRYREVSTT